jgi:conjugal transfer pilus assembly protein TraW
MNLKTKKGIGFVLAGLLLFSNAASAKNIGQYGQVFQVDEEDIRQIIMKRLESMQQSDSLLHVQHEIEQRIAAHTIRPKPLTLTTTSKPKTFRIDPTVTISHDIWTPDGLLIAKGGLRINPFERIHYLKTLFFFNADDTRQVAWVKKHYADFNHVKFILTGGDVRVAAELFGRIYFDVNGLISTKLHIKHVPSIVNQDGLYWQVREVGVFDE